MKNRTHVSLIALAALIAVNLLVSCGPKREGGDRRAQQGAPSSERIEGTSDTGGGTGINDKVFESYIVDPLKLPAFKQHLAKLLKNIKSDKGEDTPDYHMIFKIKTWYIAPIELDKISKGVLGVSFIKSDTQQIALQTSKAVWIDKRVYDKMTSQEQADLLLHELVMNMYFFKFMPIKEMCTISDIIESKKSGESCGESVDLIDQARPAEKLRPLNDEDNENIRFVTGWLLQNAQKPVSANTLLQVLAAKGFDRRYFDPTSSGSDTEPIAELKISSKEIFRAIKGAELTGNMPTVCAGLTNGKTKQCKFEIEERMVSFNNIKLPGFAFRLKVDGEAPMELSMYISEELALAGSDDNEGGIIYTLPILDIRDKYKVGERVHYGFLLFRKVQQQSVETLNLESAIWKPGIIISTDKKRDPVCLVRSLKGTQFTDDGLTVKHPGTMPTVIERLFSAAEPMSACSAQTVDE